MKKPRKKYRPKPVMASPRIIDLVQGAVTEAEAELLYEVACRSLDKCHLVTTEPTDYQNVGTAIRTVFVLSAAYEDKAKLRQLSLLAWAGLKLANCYAVALDMKLEHIVDGKKSPQTITAALAPAQQVLAVFKDMLMSSPRAEIISAQRVANRYWYKIPVENIAVLSDNGTAPADDDDFVGERGVAWIHGEARAGFLDWDGSRLVWRMPETESQVHLADPTLILKVPSGTNYVQERLS